jgi:hypothetical protein
VVTFHGSGAYGTGDLPTPCGAGQPRKAAA